MGASAYKLLCFSTPRQFILPFNIIIKHGDANTIVHTFVPTSRGYVLELGECEFLAVCRAIFCLYIYM